MRRLASAAERSQQIAGELLDWCRTRGTKRQGATLAWVPLEPLLLEIVAEQGPAAAQKSLTMGTKLAAIRGWHMHTDRGRLGRIMANLLVNAVRYTPTGGRVYLDATWQEDAGARVLALEVRDTGAGISPQEQESIFHPFERGQTGRDSDPGGSGVGLAVVDDLTQELGLRCMVESAAGQGSQFRVLIPDGQLRNPASQPTVS
jgi:signal transduction histidine kinase